MGSFIYKTYKEALEFAKRMAKEGLFVKVKASGNEFEVIENNSTTQFKKKQITEYPKKRPDYGPPRASHLKPNTKPLKPYLEIPTERNPRNMGKSLNSDLGSATKKVRVIKGTAIPKPDHKNILMKVLQVHETTIKKCGLGFGVRLKIAINNLSFCKKIYG